MARRIFFLVCSFLLVALALTDWSSGVLSQESWPPAEERGDVLPTPPEQSAWWSPPPPKLPGTLVSAAVNLFQLGLADPRGCEYREMEVLVGGYTPECRDAVVKTNGWVIPTVPQPSQRFGVCWNGLVYPLLSIGKTADLRADTLAAAKAQPQDLTVCNPGEAYAVSHKSPLPIKACLLLRLGEINLAEKLWEIWTKTPPEDVVSDKDAAADQQADQQADGRAIEQAKQQHRRDPYVVLANNWALAIYDRARAAHLRGDDRLALAAAEMLVKIGPAVKAEARRRGFSPAAMEDTILNGNIDDLSIVADQRRRARERKTQTAPAVRADEYRDPAKFWAKFRQELDQCPDKAHRIAFLIRELEEVSAPGAGCLAMWGNSSMQDTIPLLLAAEGDEAVEPLLACLERDDRLTRWHPYSCVDPVGVRVLAKVALSQMLDLPLPEIKGDAAQTGNVEANQETREAIAARVRAYWQRYKGMPAMERWYNILADDREPGRWLAAARTIVQSDGVADLGGFAVLEARDDFTPSDRQMRGEILRRKAAPSVAELMTGRVKALNGPFEEFAARRGKLDRELGEKQRKLDEQARKLKELQEELNKQPQEERRYEALNKRLEQLQERREELEKERQDLQAQRDESDSHENYWCTASLQACKMALCLARWDPAAALPVLREQTRLAMAATGESIDDRPVPDFARNLVQLLLARADAGDLDALDEYAAWIRSMKRISIPGSPPSYPADSIEWMLAPLWEHANHPSIAAATEWLFSAKESPWNPLVAARETPEGRVSVAALRSPLITLPAFRRHVARLLEDRREAGQVNVVGNEEIHTSVWDGQGTTRTTIRNDPLCPPPGTRTNFRVCDACAYGVSGLAGAPKCELFWPEKERDRAVDACAGFLRQYGRAFRPVPERYRYGDLHVELMLPIRERPATPEDVHRGGAVFSLAGRGAVRVCKMPGLPLTARWTTRKDYPILEDRWDDASHKYKKIVGYEQAGIVWQAEEIQSGGHWQRYYGFVGRFGLARVPAEEIDFPWDWLTASRVGLPVDTMPLEPMPLDESFDIGWTSPGSAPVLAIGSPLVCRLLVRNHSPLERTLPALATGIDRAKPPGDVVAIETSLCWVHPLTYMAYTETNWSWTPLKPKDSNRPILNQPQRPLAPGEAFEVLRIDLDKQYGPLRPGYYGFRIKLASSQKTRSQEGPYVFFILIRSQPKSWPEGSPQ